ncbi:unnamed protein product [Rotaria sp. Silwood1]|nr:unnamed protein product [Rotaria sp. Silwood1]CAF1576143.1 unnamed protein product [Rotaria sp. Silwood1]CAF3681045.1 unnamed protein product [Rotaria sp. Silwood1]CAF3711143.1 unnamed protein product [Rotaria sp. Silwood1]
MEKSSSKESIGKKRQSKPVSTECKICRAPAIDAYYGVISCHSCKIFFKRNLVERQKLLQCRWNGNCEININTRHVCSSCRLRKCFTNEMQIEMIRGSYSHRNKTKKNTNEIDIPIQTTSTVIARLNEPEQVRLFLIVLFKKKRSR